MLNSPYHDTLNIVFVIPHNIDLIILHWLGSSTNNNFAWVVTMVNFFELIAVAILHEMYTLSELAMLSAHKSIIDVTCCANVHPHVAVESQLTSRRVFVPSCLREETFSSKSGNESYPNCYVKQKLLSSSGSRENLRDSSVLRFSGLVCSQTFFFFNLKQWFQYCLCMMLTDHSCCATKVHRRFVLKSVWNEKQIIRYCVIQTPAICSLWLN